ncbi:unnamed protein product [Rotaria socialis]|uniref:Uncharacterized protein n=2 Tax=Rotaria socialis TaxID=392032 RepID=A0A821N8N3_9BILA|nr:unnamed protein product [Rotaria socialis]CAF3340815.1 unnamed protein product [Rotaria socialis]CAF3501371.1 unnamed protein product [Rotaria socialis]CAF4210657.1 unnamed protein product [Rotaria socialis]CAF4783341.1 unnamed protein product [Rotaria socialis]
MAVGDYFPAIVSPIAYLNEPSLSKCPPLFDLRRRMTPVGTHNSSTFIRFPISSRTSTAFVPIYQQRTYRSSFRPTPIIKDTHSISDNSKSSNPTPSSIVSDQQKPNLSKKMINPILNNPLLNYRKERPKPIPNRFQTSFSNTSRLGLASKATINNNPKSKFRANTAPLLANEIETTSNEQITSNESEYEDQKEIEFFDESKYNYITRWIQGIRVTENGRTETLPKIRNSKNRLVQS